MKNEATHITVILDRTGSMESIRNAHVSFYWYVLRNEVWLSRRAAEAGIFRHRKIMLCQNCMATFSSQLWQW